MQVIAINGRFPGPIVNVTTNYNVVVNVNNNLDEPLLITWYVLSELFTAYFICFTLFENVCHSKIFEILFAAISHMEPGQEYSKDEIHGKTVYWARPVQFLRLGTGHISFRLRIKSGAFITSQVQISRELQVAMVVLL